MASRRLDAAQQRIMLSQVEALVGTLGEPGLAEGA